MLSGTDTFTNNLYNATATSSAQPMNHLGATHVDLDSNNYSATTSISFDANSIPSGSVALQESDFVLNFSDTTGHPNSGAHFPVRGTPIASHRTSPVFRPAVSRHRSDSRAKANSYKTRARSGSRGTSCSSSQSPASSSGRRRLVLDKNYSKRVVNAHIGAQSRRDDVLRSFANS